MTNQEIKNQLNIILNKINTQVIGTWNSSLENTTEAVIIEDTDTLPYNNWLTDLEQLVNKLNEGKKYARLCTCCGKGMNEGYFANYEYFCSDSCLRTEFSGSEWEQLTNEDDDNYYWTEWEDAEDYQYQIINGILEEIN
jgi:hypothetical protein